MFRAVARASTIHTRTRICALGLRYNTGSSKILRPNQKDAPADQRPIDREPRPSKGTLSDYDIYDDLAAPLNNIDGVLENGFQLASGARVLSSDTNNPKGLVLLGSEAFEVDLSQSIKGLEKGILELDKSIMGVFDVAMPKPELLVVGLGKKSRIFGPQTTKYLQSLGIQTHVSNTVNGCSNFDLLATERPGQVAAFLLPPNL